MTGWASYVIRRIFGFHGERLRNYFDDLELEKVIPQLLRYVQSRVDARNVVWIHADEFRRQKSNAEFEPLPSADGYLHLQAAMDMTLSDAHAHIKSLGGESLMGEISTGQGYANVLVPIVHPSNREIMAYVLAVGCPASSARRVLGTLNRDLHYMSKHVSFSLKHWQAQQLTMKDDLTDLYNQKFLTIALENEISRAQRAGKKFTVLFMDIDYFKSVNDTMGHWVGSRLLIEVGRIVAQNIRKSDYPFRYGGDEFVVILSDTDSDGARVSAERLRELIEKTDFLIDGENIKLTLSIGLATYPDHAKTHKDIIKMADEAMYCGKNKSRNVVYVAS